MVNYKGKLPIYFTFILNFGTLKKTQQAIREYRAIMSLHESWHNVGNKIRYLRKSIGLTQKQLARGCDLSANTISLVERCEVAPNIETLCKVANALGVSPGSLFLEICRPGVVLQRAIVTEGGTDIAERTFQLRSIAPQITEPVQKVPSPDLKSRSERRHSILCLCGQVEVEMDGQNYCLNPGDSLAVNSDTFHRWRNSNQITGIAVLVLPPTSFQESPVGT